MTKKRNLSISYGKLSEEDKGWDIRFWQTISTDERFSIAHKMVEDAYEHKTGCKPPTKIDLGHIVSGSYSND